jgi:hypothetical protein
MDNLLENIVCIENDKSKSKRCYDFKKHLEFSKIDPQISHLNHEYEQENLPEENNSENILPIINPYIGYNTIFSMIFLGLCFLVIIFFAVASL